jgi:pyruvate kinase
MEYQIIATLGPASQSESAWRAMLAAGATGFRLNTSHLSLAEALARLERLRPFLAGAAPSASLVLDLQGSKWRLGQFPARDLAPGETVRLVLAPQADLPGELPVPHADFFRAAPVSSDEIVLNDAKLCLRREAAGPDFMQATVLRGGPVSPRKGITYAASDFRHEAMCTADEAVLDHTRTVGGIRYALSYVRDAGEMARYREQIGRDAYLIAKLERPLAVAQAQSVATAADELWLCRGDLGAEVGLPGMAAAAHSFATEVAQGRLKVPALLAGQVFEHLTEHPTPTRSEVCAVYDALAQGYGGFVLSDETAIGRDPAEAVRAAAMFRSGLL